MKKKTLILLILFLFVSCNVYRNVNDKDLPGVFSHKRPFKKTNTLHVLKLINNNEFILYIRPFEWSSRCTGLWERKKDKIILKCNGPKNIVEALSIGCMGKREFVIKIINKNKLFLDNIILKRKKRSRFFSQKVFR